mmetsp:Transcript_60/g.69  ORF Transcript_60/g.69 Transcript_60/m.69 type:complete len:126 (+) Transcript_60:1146-1523(+)
MHYDEETLFNENNVTQFLAELEEYIAILITFISYKQSNQDAAISSLSLEKMVLKEFDKGPMNIDISSLNELNQLEEVETEDEVITNGKDLYKKFENLVQKDGNSKSYNNSMSKAGASIMLNSKLE